MAEQLLAEGDVGAEEGWRAEAAQHTPDSGDYNFSRPPPDTDQVGQTSQLRFGEGQNCADNFADFVTKSLQGRTLTKKLTLTDTIIELPSEHLQSKHKLVEYNKKKNTKH